MSYGIRQCYLTCHPATVTFPPYLIVVSRITKMHFFSGVSRPLKKKGLISFRGLTRCINLPVELTAQVHVKLLCRAA